jgi:hypothetical protein
MGDIFQISDVNPLAGGHVAITAPLPAFAIPSYSVIVRRGTTKNPFLGPDGWQPVEHAFPAQSCETIGDRVQLILGPELVDSAIRPDDVVQLTIPELDLTDVVVWSGITRSVTLTDVPKVTATPTAIKPTSEPDSGADIAPDVGPDFNQQAPNKFGKMWVLLVLAILIGGGVYWAFFHDTTPTDPIVVPIPEIEEAVSLPPDPAENPIDSDTDRPADHPAQSAAEDAQSAYQRGVAAFEAGECPSARSALQHAKSKEYGPALLFWAQQQDSVEFQPCITGAANDISALNHYKRACEAGVDTVMPDLNAFETELKRRAAQGDIVASEVLRVAFPNIKTICGG